MSDSATPWTTARQASLSFAISQSLLQLMPIESVMPSNHLILCHPVPFSSCPQSFPASGSFPVIHMHITFLSWTSLPFLHPFLDCREVQSWAPCVNGLVDTGREGERGTNGRVALTYLHYPVYRERVIGICSSSGLDLVSRGWIDQPVKYKRNLTLHIPKFYVEII